MPAVGLGFGPFPHIARLPPRLLTGWVWWPIIEVDDMTAKVTYASDVGIAVANSAADNLAAYAAWRDSASYNDHTLILDQSGTYQTSGSWFIPNYRRITADASCIVQATAAMESVIATGLGSVVDSVTADANSNATYAVHAAYSGALIHGVGMRNAVNDGLRAYNAAVLVQSCTSHDNGRDGFRFEAASESLAYNLYSYSNTTNVHILGNLGALSIPNGGRMTIHGIRSGLATYGMEFAGVAQSDIHGVTHEAVTTAYRIHDASSNVRIFGARANSGTYAAIFDGCHNCAIYGGFGASQKVQHINNARGNIFDGNAESHTGFANTTHEFGSTSPWEAYYRHGQWLSKDNTAPTKGYWDAGEIILAFSATSGNPMGWRCDTSGVAGAGAVFTALPNMP